MYVIYPFFDIDTEAFAWNFISGIGERAWNNWNLLVHEYAHFVQYHIDILGVWLIDYLFGRNWNMEDDLIHRYNKLHGQNLAWSEAWASAFSLIAQDYFASDYTAIHQAGGSRINIWNMDNLVFANTEAGRAAQQAQGQAQPLSITASLWQIFTSPNISTARNHRAWWNKTTRRRTFTLSDFTIVIDTYYPQYRHQIGQILGNNRIAPRSVVLTNASNVSIAVSPEVRWITGGSINNPNNQFRIAFYNSNNQLLVRTEAIDGTEAFNQFQEEELSDTIWRKVINHPNRTPRIYVSVHGFNTAPPVSGPFFSAKVPITADLGTPGLVFYGAAVTGFNMQPGFNGAVVIPEGATSIGYRAFAGNTHIRDITIPPSVREIGADAFIGTSPNLQVRLETGREHIQEGLFENTGVRNVVIPSSVTHIGSRAFVNTNIGSLTIPSSVREVETEAFGSGVRIRWHYNQSMSVTNLDKLRANLDTVIIPAGLTQIRVNRFAGASNLRTVIFESNSNLSRIANGAFENTGLRSIALPHGMTDIGVSAFAGTELTRINLPQSLRTIGANAFAGTGLAYITLPQGVTSVGAGAFDSTVRLTWIYNSSFDISNIRENLYTVTIPHNITAIRANHFAGASNLQTVNMHPASQLTHIGANAFAGTDLRIFNLPHGASLVGTDAFPAHTRITWWYNPHLDITGIRNNLETITIPHDITEIRANHFADAVNLGTVNFAGNSRLHTIGEGAFSNTSLAHINLGFNVMYIGQNAFDSDVRITWRYNRDLDITNILYNLEEVFMWDFNITEIRAFRFANAVNLQIIETMPLTVNGHCISNITRIGIGAFSNTGLTSFDVPVSVISIGQTAFAGTDLRTLNLNRFASDSDNPITVLSNVNAFEGNSLEAIYVPYGDGIIEAYRQAANWSEFYELFRSMNRPPTNTGTLILTIIERSEFGNIDFYRIITISRGVYTLPIINIPVLYNDRPLMVIGGGSFAGLPNLKHVEFAAGSMIREIETEAFRGSGLESFVVPMSVERIGVDAFFGTPLWNNAANNSVVNAGAWAVGVKGAVSGNVTLGAGTAGIADRTFANQTALTSVTIPHSAEEGMVRLGGEVFANAPNLRAIYVPDEAAAEAYRQAPDWAEFADIIRVAGSTAAIIWSARDLPLLAANPDGYFRLGGNISVTAWTLIPSFSGVLDGNGYTINGRGSINAADGYAGFFGRLYGTVRNLTIDSFSVFGHPGVNAGVLAGWLGPNGIVDNVSVFTRAGGSAGGSSTGGLVGYSQGIIRNSRVDFWPQTAEMVIGDIFGGIAGTNNGGQLLNNTVTNLLTREVLSNRNLGGIVGFQAGGSAIGNTVIGFYPRILNSSFHAIGGIAGTHDTGYPGEVNGNTVIDAYITYRVNLNGIFQFPTIPLTLHVGRWFA